MNSLEIRGGQLRLRSGAGSWKPVFFPAPAGAGREPLDLESELEPESNRGIFVGARDGAGADGCY